MSNASIRRDATRSLRNVLETWAGHRVQVLQLTAGESAAVKSADGRIAMVTPYDWDVTDDDSIRVPLLGLRRVRRIVDSCVGGFWRVVEVEP